MKRAILLCGVLVCGFADAQTLTWNPTVSGVWDLTSENWLDGVTPSAWVQGASAVFDGAGGFVEVSADVSAGGVAFASGNYTLTGCGRIRLEGVLDVAAGATNSVATELFSEGGVTKTGAGAVAIGTCVGPLIVSGGDLLATASDFADAQITVAAGGRIVTAGEPTHGVANLIQNGGFEEFALAPGGWAYANGAATNLGAWGVAALPSNVGGLNLAAGGAAPPWASIGAAPEEAHVLILQYASSVTQQVTVAAAGWYQVALSHFMRRDYPETALYVTLDGVAFPTIINDAQEFFHRRYVSVPFWLEPGVYLLGLTGEGTWGDRASLVDDVVLAPAFAAATECRSLGGDSSVTLQTGAAAVLNHSGSLGVARLDVSNGSVSGSGAWGASPSVQWFDFAGGVWAPPLAMGEDALLRMRLAGTLALEGLARRVWASGGAEISGTGLTLTNAVSAKVARLTVSDTDTVQVTAPLALRNRTTLDVFGSLSVEGGVALTNVLTSKRGFGTVDYAVPLGLENHMNILEGRVRLGAVPYRGGNGGIYALTTPARAAEVVLQEAGATRNEQMFFCGLGQAALRTDMGGGATSLPNHPRISMTNPLCMDVADGDTLSIRQLCIWVNGGFMPQGGLVKTGPGTLEIREGGGDAGNNRAYLGRTVLRNGTLRVLVDDTGNLTGPIAYNGTTASGFGGSLGAGPLSDAVWVGDAATLPTDSLTFVAAGNKRFIGHDFEVFGFGDDVRFEAEGDVAFAGTFTLHRGVTFAGPPGAHLTLGGALSAGGGALTLEGFSRVTVNGAVDGGGLDLDIGDRILRLGFGEVAASHLNTFAADGGALGLNVGGGGVSSLTAGTVTLGTLAIGLYYQGSDIPISEPGTYTLMTAATMSVDTNKLSVADAVPGFDYVFEESGGVLTLTLTDTGAGGGGTVWDSPESGAWETGSNWKPATPPDDSAVTVKLGSSLTNNATVTLGAPFTVGALEINNLFWSYTLEGAPLTFGAPARIDMLGGSHTIANTLDAGGPISVTTGSGTLTFGGTGGVLAPVALEQGALTLADSATLAGGVSVADGARLTVSGADTTVGTSLDGGPGGGLTFAANSKLTLDQTQGGGLTGVVQGPATAQIIRGGPGTWTLAGEPGSSYEGSFLQGGAGETVLSGLPMTGGVAAEAGGGLTFAPAVTNGLMGYYYYLGNQGNVQALTNAFKSVALMDEMLAGRRPDLIWQSCTASENFDYPLTEGPTLSFPYPFGGNGVSAGPYQYFFVAAWRGSITVPETGQYSFGVNADDYALLAIDGELLYSAVAYVGGIFYRTVQLTEGRHDILVGLGQLSGNGGIRLWVRAPSESAHILLPNSWLTPMVPVGALNSAGGVTVQGGANVSVGTSGPGVLSGALNIGAGGVLEKAGTSVLDLRGGPNMVEGDVNVRNGTLALRAPDQLGPSGRLTVRETGVVSLLAPQTVGALSGKGPVLFGSGSIDVVPFTGDGDCEISPAKTYSHLLDFPTDEAPATVNGVTFGADAGHSFSANLTVMDPDDNATGIVRLLSGFCYNVADYTLTLTGLQPFTAYEVRLYFKMWGNGNADRNVTFTFTAGANAAGSETHNIDFASTPYHFLRCNYATDENGSLDIRLFSNNGGTTCHLYALSNELLGDAMGDLALTVAAPAGTDALYGGAFTGSGALVKDGPGTQRFSGANNLSGGLAVLDGEATLMPGASVAGVAEVGAGAALSAPFGSVTLGGLSGDGAFSTGLQNGNYPYPANVPYQHFFTDDATSQISPLKRYTHKLDFGNRDNIPSGVPGATVNGVTFTKADINGSENGYGWSTIGNQRHAGNASADVTGDVHALLTDMVYGRQNNPETDPPGIGQITGLTPGKEYEVRIYNRIWTPDQLATGLRKQTVSFVPDPAVTNVFTFEQDAQPANFLAYRYTPTSDTLTIINETHAVNATWHIYALTNEEVDDAPVVLDMAVDTAFGGTVTGDLEWVKRGEGALLMTGDNTVTGPLTIEAGAFGVGAGGTATLGPVSVLDGALLFGQGTVGGAVDIADGAWIQAGETSACGTLAIGNDLLIEDGANIKFRYASPALADTIMVGGVLTLPNSGVVYAQPIAGGVKPPVKWLLFGTTSLIDGPADLSGWVVDGIPTAKLTYGPGKTSVYVSDPRGTLLMIR